MGWSNETWFRIAGAAGRGASDCWLLFHATDDPDDFHYDTVDSYIARRIEGAVAIEQVFRRTCLTHLCIAPDGALFAQAQYVGHGADHDLPRGLWSRTPDAPRWSAVDSVPSTLSGHVAVGTTGRVFASGGSPESGDAYVRVRDGAAWRAVPSPGLVTALDGPSHDALVAVGRRPDDAPFIARWDGLQWHAMEVPPGGAPRTVCALDEERFYVGGAGFLWEGSPFGWVERDRFDWPFTVQQLVAWQGALWAATSAGIAVLRDGSFDVVGAEFSVVRGVSAGEALLAFEEDALLETRDGSTFTRYERDDLTEAMGFDPW